MKATTPDLSSDWKMRKLDRRGEVLAACGAIELVKDVVFHFPCRSNASFKHFGAYVQRNVAAGHEKTARGCEENGLKELSPDGVMRKWELASPWPSRRGWLPEAVAWIRRGNDGSANAGGPTTIVG